MKLRGQSALIVGGGRGLGRAIALAFGSEGANVVVADIVEERAVETSRAVEASGVRSLSVACDASNEREVEALIARTTRELGRLDILVNTAAWIDPPALIADLSLDVWEKTFRFDLTTYFLTCKHAVTAMIPRKYGRIVNVATEVAGMGVRTRGAYSAAKAGVVSLSRTLSVENAEHGIIVNALCPGGIAGERLDEIRSLMTPPREPQDPSVASHRLMDPREVADIVTFLVSPEGTRIRGQALVIGSALP